MRRRLAEAKQRRNGSDHAPAAIAGDRPGRVHNVRAGLAITFREAAAQDIASIAALHADSWRRHYRPTAMRSSTGTSSRIASRAGVPAQFSH